jgi:hypothetical protein
MADFRTHNDRIQGPVYLPWEQRRVVPASLSPSVVRLADPPNTPNSLQPLPLERTSHYEKYYADHSNRKRTMD